MTEPLRWLHISDFHVGKDNYGQRRLFKEVIAEARAQVATGAGPDLVFITGDIANRGAPSEYTEFVDEFLAPLLSATTPRGAFAVPGNHDVDRSAARAVQKHGVLKNVREFLDPDPNGLAQRQSLLDRFAAYRGSGLPPDGDWLASAEGTFRIKLAIRGAQVGVVGLNTAWLSESDLDRHHLSPGKYMLQEALEAVADCDVKFVLGHHPLDWLIDEEVPSVRADLARNRAIYLCGHLHRIASERSEGAGEPLWTFQAGAGFQAREDEQWVNRILLGELEIPAGLVRLHPLQWSSSDMEWKPDGTAFPARNFQNGAWLFSISGNAELVPTIAHLTSTPNPQPTLQNLIDQWEALGDRIRKNQTFLSFLSLEIVDSVAMRSGQDELQILAKPSASNS
jgi:predicted MPP superfamily phosphohydrolase